MAQTEKTYTRIPEAEEMIKQLQERYPDELWAVKPENLMVMGIDNKERGKKNYKLAKILSVKGVEKAIFREANVNIQYIVEIYCSDWAEWTSKKKQLILFHEVLHESSKGIGCVKHDCEDFRMMLDVLGVDWANKPDSELPNLLTDDEKVQFNLNLRPNMLEYCEENDIKIEDLNAENKQDDEDAAEDANEVAEALDFEEEVDA